MAEDGSRILLTGAAGFFGRRIHRALEDVGARVTALNREDLDLTDGAKVVKTVALLEPEVVVNAAGISSPRACRENPAACFGANTAATFNLLEAIRTGMPAARLVSLSSAAVYGPGSGDPLAEDDPLSPHSVYGASKLAAEVIGGQFIRSGTGRVTTLRVFNLVGPGQPADQAAAEFARDVRDALKEGRREVSITVGDPKISRDFTDVRDAAGAVARAVAEPATVNRIFNLCSGRAVSLREITDHLAGLVRRPGEPPFEVRLETDPARTSPGDPHTVCGSGERLLQATGWQATVPLKHSLRNLLAELIPAEDPAE